MDSFNNEVKKLWKSLTPKRKRNLVFAFSLLSLIFLFLTVLDIYKGIGFLNGFLQNLYSDLIVGVVVGILVAFYFTEYMEEREKPILELWVEQERDERFSKTNIDKYKIEQEIVKNHDAVDRPIIGGKVYSFQFSLLLGNIGRKTGKLIKVSLRLVCNGNPEYYGRFTYFGGAYQEPFLVLHEQNTNIGEWAKITPFTGENTFRSNENLVVYSRRDKEEINREWLDEIGKFELFVPLRVEKEQEVEISLECSVQGDGSELIHQNFNVTFN